MLSHRGAVPAGDKAAAAGCGQGPLREALHRRVSPTSESVRYDLWTPSTRADLVTVDPIEMVGFEIKSDRDNLDRLARQVTCYQMVFDRCHVVTGRRHLEAIEKVLPSWWGLTIAGGVGGAGELEEVRAAQANPARRCAETVVQLLWKADVAAALCRLDLITGRELRVMSRNAMWKRLVDCADSDALGACVRRAMLDRALRRRPDPAGADSTPWCARCAAHGALRCWGCGRILDRPCGGGR